MKQTYFDFEGIDFEQAYATLAMERTVEELEEEFGVDFVHGHTGLDTNYLTVWRDLSDAQEEFEKIPEFKRRIKNAEQGWDRHLNTSIPTYEEYLEKERGQASKSFLKLAIPDAVAKINKIIKEFNALPIENKAKTWNKYYHECDLIVHEIIPKFIEIRGCRNCKITEYGKKYGSFDHERTSGCLVYGCQRFGITYVRPFIDPEESVSQAKQEGTTDAIENSRKYVLHVKETFGMFYNKIGISLDSLLTKLSS
jgi:hypothetical protein